MTGGVLYVELPIATGEILAAVVKSIAHRL